MVVRLVEETCSHVVPYGGGLQFLSQSKVDRVPVFMLCPLHWSTKFNFFLAHEEKYLILIELLTLNSNV